MTREEQIHNEASNYGYAIAGGELRRPAISKAFLEGAKWADENPKSPWISIEERLPEEHTNVIVTDGSNVAHSIKYGDGFYTNVGKCRNVTHWMPIPELPKEDV